MSIKKLKIYSRTYYSFYTSKPGNLNFYWLANEVREEDPRTGYNLVVKGSPYSNQNSNDSNKYRLWKSYYDLAVKSVNNRSYPVRLVPEAEANRKILKFPENPYKIDYKDENTQISKVAKPVTFNPYHNDKDWEVVEENFDNGTFKYKNVPSDTKINKGDYLVVNTLVKDVRLIEKYNFESGILTLETKDVEDTDIIKDGMMYVDTEEKIQPGQSDKPENKIFGNSFGIFHPKSMDKNDLQKIRFNLNDSNWEKMPDDGQRGTVYKNKKDNVSIVEYDRLHTDQDMLEDILSGFRIKANIDIKTGKIKKFEYEYPQKILSVLPDTIKNSFEFNKDDDSVDNPDEAFAEIKILNGGIKTTGRRLERYYFEKNKLKYSDARIEEEKWTEIKYQVSVGGEIGFDKEKKANLKKAIEKFKDAQEASIAKIPAFSFLIGGVLLTNKINLTGKMSYSFSGTGSITSTFKTDKIKYVYEKHFPEGDSKGKETEKNIISKVKQAPTIDEINLDGEISVTPSLSLSVETKGYKFLPVQETKFELSFPLTANYGVRKMGQKVVSNNCSISSDIIGKITFTLGGIFTLDFLPKLDINLFEWKAESLNLNKINSFNNNFPGFAITKDSDKKIEAVSSVKIIGDKKGGKKETNEKAKTEEDSNDAKEKDTDKNSEGDKSEKVDFEKSYQKKLSITIVDNPYNAGNVKNQYENSLKEIGKGFGFSILNNKEPESISKDEKLKAKVMDLSEGSTKIIDVNILDAWSYEIESEDTENNVKLKHTGLMLNVSNFFACSSASIFILLKEEIPNKELKNLLFELGIEESEEKINKANDFFNDGLDKTVSNLLSFLELYNKSYIKIIFKEKQALEKDNNYDSKEWAGKHYVVLGGNDDKKEKENTKAKHSSSGEPTDIDLGPIVKGDLTFNYDVQEKPERFKTDKYKLSERSLLLRDNWKGDKNLSPGTAVTYSLLDNYQLFKQIITVVDKPSSESDLVEKAKELARKIPRGSEYEREDSYYDNNKIKIDLYDFNTKNKINERIFVGYGEKESLGIVEKNAKIYKERVSDIQKIDFYISTSDVIKDQKYKDIKEDINEKVSIVISIIEFKYKDKHYQFIEGSRFKERWFGWRGDNEFPEGLPPGIEKDFYDINYTPDPEPEKPKTEDRITDNQRKPIISGGNDQTIKNIESIDISNLTLPENPIDGIVAIKINTLPSGFTIPKIGTNYDHNQSYEKKNNNGFPFSTFATALRDDKTLSEAADREFLVHNPKISNYKTIHVENIKRNFQLSTGESTKLSGIRIYRADDFNGYSQKVVVFEFYKLGKNEFGDPNMLNIIFHHDITKTSISNVKTGSDFEFSNILEDFANQMILVKKSDKNTKDSRTDEQFTKSDGSESNNNTPSSKYDDLGVYKLFVDGSVPNGFSKMMDVGSENGYQLNFTNIEQYGTITFALSRFLAKVSPEEMKSFVNQAIESIKQNNDVVNESSTSRIFQLSNGEVIELQGNVIVTKSKSGSALYDYHECVIIDNISWIYISSSGVEKNTYESFLKSLKLIVK